MVTYTLFQELEPVPDEWTVLEKTRYAYKGMGRAFLYHIAGLANATVAVRAYLDGKYLGGSDGIYIYPSTGSPVPLIKYERGGPEIRREFWVEVKDIGGADYVAVWVLLYGTPGMTPAVVPRRPSDEFVISPGATTHSLTVEVVVE